MVTCTLLKVEVSKGYIQTVEVGKIKEEPTSKAKVG